MVVKQEGGKWFVFSKEGKKLSKGYSSEEEAKKRLGQIEHFKQNKGESEGIEFSYTVPVTECEVIERDEKNNPKTVRVGGTCLVETISRNNNRYTINNIKENDGKTVKFFAQEHGTLKLKNVVGKVNLSESDGKLMYDGKLRNTKAHPDIVEHALNKEVDVSIDARAQGKKVSEKDGQKVYSWDKVDIRALCGVGIGGVSENNMEYAVAESFGEYPELPPTTTVPEKPKLNEVKKLDEIEKLRAELKEKEEALAKANDTIRLAEEEKVKEEEAAKESLRAEILKVNAEVNESELKDLSLRELKMKKDYETKLVAKESEDDDEGDGEVKDEEEAPAEESEIVINEKDDTITMSESAYKKFQDDMRFR